MRILFVGGGNMAAALIGALLRGGTPASALRVLDPNDHQRRRLHEVHGVRCAAPSALRSVRADVVVWAVKPQHLKEAAEAANPALRSALHISVAAGVAATTLSRWLQAVRVVRAMPNSPAMIGEGCTGLFALAAVHAEDRRLTERLLRQTGATHWLDSDAQVDAITAISGSGPAYVFQFLEALQGAAEHLGFSPALARELVLQTVRGAVLQAQGSVEALALLRQRVTSDKGTSAAALAVLDGQGIAATYERAVAAAFVRAQEIGAESAQQ